jgi:hypothetical protein
MAGAVAATSGEDAARSRKAAGLGDMGEASEKAENPVGNEK